MSTTYEVLSAEAKRLRDLADRIDAFAAELKGTLNGHSPKPPEPALAGFGEYAGMKQGEAILKALEHGPQTTRQLFDRLNAGGQTFKQVTYVTAILPRLRDKVERIDGGRIRLKSPSGISG